MRRLRPVAIVLLLLACLVGALLVVLGDEPSTPAARHRHDAVAPPGDDGVAEEAPAVDETARRHVDVAAPPSSATSQGAADGDPPQRLLPIVRRRLLPEKDAAGVLHVRVIDERGAPRDDVRLNVVALQGDERSSLHGGPVGADGITFEGLGNDRATLRATVGSLERLVVVWSAKGHRTDVDMVVPHGARVAGTIRHAEHGSLDGARVELIAGSIRPGEGDAYDALRTNTRAGGRYELTEVPPGQYAMHVSGGRAGSGLAPCATPWIAGSGAVRLDVTLGEPSLTGTVIDAATGDPLPGALVVVAQTARALARSRDDGRFSLTDLPAGVHTVTVSHEGYVAVERRVELAESGEPPRLDFALDAKRELVVEARGPDGLAVATRLSVAVTAVGEDNRSASRWTSVASGGRLTIQDLAPGTYELHVQAPGYQARTVRARADAASTVVPVELAWAPEGERPGRIQGVVVHAETRAPIEGAIVSDPDFETATTDDDGRFVLVYVGARPETVDVRLDGFGGERVTTGAEGALEVALRPAATLVLRLRGPEDQSLGGDVRIEVRDHDAGATEIGGYTEADEEGVATWRGLVAGRYVLQIDSDLCTGTVDVQLSPGRNVVDVRME